MKIKIIKEVYSQKQRRFMCAVSKQGADRPKGLSKAEAEEMCKGPMKEEELEELYSTAGSHGHIHPKVSDKKEFNGFKEKANYKNIQNFKDPVHIEEILDEMEYDLTKIKQKSTLNRKFWDKNRLLDRKTRDKLIAIAEDFIENVGLEGKVKDITMTGSLASYNWHKNSDIDLHILINYDDLTMILIY